MIHKVIPGIAFVHSLKNVKIGHFRSFYGQKNRTPESTDVKGFEASAILYGVLCGARPK